MLVRYDPFRPFEQYWRAPAGPAQSSLMPLDAYRREDEFVVELDLPGVDEHAIDVSVEEHVLTVTAERTARYGRDDQVLASERQHGQVTRRLHLDRSVDPGGIVADYAAGVLTLRIPIAEAARPRKIEVGGNGHKAMAATTG